MKTEVRFYKENGKWYADIPNHTKEENEMVMGSDDALDWLLDSANDWRDEEKNEITLTLSDEDTNEYVFHFSRAEHDEDGAYYQACGDYDLLYPIWICNVTHDVFGEHPENLYILKIS